MTFKVPICVTCGKEILNFKHLHKKYCTTCLDKRRLRQIAEANLRKKVRDLK